MVWNQLFLIINDLGSFAFELVHYLKSLSSYSRPTIAILLQYYPIVVSLASLFKVPKTPSPVSRLYYMIATADGS